MKLELADYLNAETEKLKAEQRAERAKTAKQVMGTQVRCTIYPKFNSMELFRGDKLIGMAYCQGGEPKITLFSDGTGIIRLTFNDLEVIGDNWNAMQEQREGKCWNAE